MLRMHGFAAIVLLTLGGCAGYNTWPPQEGVVGFSDPNARPNDQVILASLQYIVERYPPDSERYAINLPEGMNDRLYRWIVDRVGDGAEPVQLSNQTLPVYHVKQIKVRGRSAEVMVLRPVTEAGEGPEGDMAYQPITVKLNGGFDGWRIVNRREWIVGLESTPPLNYWSDGEPAPPEQVTVEVPDEDA